MHIVDWENEIIHAKKDEKVGIKIATLLETDHRGTYLTSIPPGSSITPHYHKEGEEEYHIISGSGVMRILPVYHKDTPIKLFCKYVVAKNSFMVQPNMIHQLINNGTEDLILLFSCPLSHLEEDRVVIENLEEFLNEELVK
jgi:mannose-6-phosphate isomerase-like protein (cupin superfamily)